MRGDWLKDMGSHEAETGDPPGARLDYHLQDMPQLPTVSSDFPPHKTCTSSPKGTTTPWLPSNQTHEPVRTFHSQTLRHVCLRSCGGTFLSLPGLSSLHSAIVKLYRCDDNLNIILQLEICFQEVFHGKSLLFILLE